MKLKKLAMLTLALALLLTLALVLMPAQAYDATYGVPGPDRIIDSGSCPEDAAKRENNGRHHWILGDWTAPYCEEPGMAYYNCGYCDDFWTMEYTPALGHDWGEWRFDETIAYAGCTDPVTRVRYCNRCGQADEETLVRGHQWGDWRVDEKPTCEEQGLDVRYCAVCGAEEWRYTAALGHDWGEGTVTSEPDCTKTGEIRFVCRRDTSHIRTEILSVAPEDHWWDGGTVTTPPTCAQPGVLTYTCKRNSAHTKTEPIPIDPDAHDWAQTGYKEATCVDEGYVEYQCQHCGKTMRENFPATGRHTFGLWLEGEKPTCTVNGWEYRVCSVCGHTEYRGVLPNGHQWSDWEVITPPGPLSYGKERRACSVCGEAEERDIPPQYDPILAVNANVWLEVEAQPDAGVGKRYEGAEVFYTNVLHNVGNVPVYISLSAYDLGGAYTDAAGNPIANPPKELEYYHPDLDGFVPGYMLQPDQYFRIENKATVSGSDVSKGMLDWSLIEYFCYVDGAGEAKEDHTNAAHLEVPLTLEGQNAQANALVVEALDIPADAGVGKRYVGAEVYWDKMLTNMGDVPVYIDTSDPVSYQDGSGDPLPDRETQSHYRPDLETNWNGYLLQPGERLVVHRNSTVDAYYEEKGFLTFSTRSYYYYQDGQGVWREDTTNAEEANIELTAPGGDIELKDHPSLRLEITWDPNVGQGKRYENAPLPSHRVVTNDGNCDLYLCTSLYPSSHAILPNPESMGKDFVGYVQPLIKPGQSLEYDYDMLVDAEAVEKGVYSIDWKIQAIYLDDSKESGYDYVQSNQVPVEILLTKQWTLKEPELKLTAKLQDDDQKLFYSQGEKVVFDLTLTNVSDHDLYACSYYDKGKNLGFSLGLLKAGESYTCEYITTVEGEGAAYFSFTGTGLRKPGPETETMQEALDQGAERTDTILFNLFLEKETGLTLTAQLQDEYKKDGYDPYDPLVFDLALTNHTEEDLYVPTIYADGTTVVYGMVPLKPGEALTYSRLVHWEDSGDGYAHFVFDGTAMLPPASVSMTLEDALTKDVLRSNTVTIDLPGTDALGYGLLLEVKQSSEDKVYKAYEKVYFDVTVTNTTDAPVEEGWVIYWENGYTEGRPFGNLGPGESATIPDWDVMTDEVSAEIGSMDVEWSGFAFKEGRTHDYDTLLPEDLENLELCNVVYTSTPVQKQEGYLYLWIDSVTPEKTVYEENDQVDVTLALTNAGEKPLTLASILCDLTDYGGYQSVRNILEKGTGFDDSVLEPGETWYPKDTVGITWKDVENGGTTFNWFGNGWIREMYDASVNSAVGSAPGLIFSNPVSLTLNTKEVPDEKAYDDLTLHLFVDRKSGEKPLYQVNDTVSFRAWLDNEGTATFSEVAINSGVGDEYADTWHQTDNVTVTDVSPLQGMYMDTDYTITPEDAQRGYVSLIWTGGGIVTEEQRSQLNLDPNMYPDFEGYVESVPDSVIITLPVQKEGASLFLDAQLDPADEQFAYQADQPMNFLYAITNNGTVNVQAPSLYDDGMLGTYDGVLLKPGESVSGTYNTFIDHHFAIQPTGEIDFIAAGWLADAEVSFPDEIKADAPGRVVSNEVKLLFPMEKFDDDDVEDLLIHVTQSPLKAVYEEGDLITFDVEMTNWSTFAYAGSFVDGYVGDGAMDDWDDLPSREGGPLNVGDSLHYQETYTITQNDVNRGYVDFEWYGYALFYEDAWPHLNVTDEGAATRDFTPADPSPYTLTLPVKQEGAAIYLEAWAETPKAFYLPDEYIQVNYRLTNVGTETLSSIYLFDGPWNIDLWEDYNLAPGMSVSDHMFVSYGKDEIEAGAGYGYMNLEAYAWPYDPATVGFTRWGEGAGKLDEAKEIFSNLVALEFPFHPIGEGEETGLHLDVTLTSAPKPVYYLNDQVTWDVTLTNTGKTPLRLPSYFFEWVYPGEEVEFTESKDTVLQPGDSVIFHDYSSVWQEDVDNGYMKFRLYGQAWLEGDGEPPMKALSESENAVQSNVGQLYFPCAQGGGEDTQRGAKLILNVSPKYPKPFYYVDDSGVTEEIPYTLTLTNAGDAPLLLGSYAVTRGGVTKVTVLTPSILYPGESCELDHYGAVFHTSDILPGTETADSLGQVEILFEAWAQEAGVTAAALDVPSNPVTLRHTLKEIEPPDSETFTVFKEEVSHPLDTVNGYVEGEHIHYLITVTNNTDQKFDYVVVHDINYDNGYGLDDIDLYHGMQPHETKTTEFDYVVDADDVDWSYVKNMAYVTWDDEETHQEGRSDSNNVFSPTTKGSPKTALSLTKDVIGGPANGSYYQVDEVVHFQVKATNHSDDDLFAITVYDPLFYNDAEGSRVGVFSVLAPGETTPPLDLYYTVTPADLIYPGVVSNIATGEAQDNRGNLITASSNWVEVPVDENSPLLAQVEITKWEVSDRGPDGYYEVGEQIDYKIKIKNTGALPVGDVEVFDCLEDPWTVPIQTEYLLNPGEERIYDYSYQVQPSDLSTGFVLNLARADFFPVVKDEVASDEGNRRQTYSEKVGSPVGEPDPNPPDPPTPPVYPPVPPTTPGEADSCVVTLIAKGTYAADYTTHYCAEHSAVAKRVEAILADAKSDVEHLGSWQMAKDIWREEVDEMYAALSQASSSAVRMALASEKAAFDQYISSLFTLLCTQRDDPVVAYRVVSEQLMNRAVELCYELNNAPAPRADSVTLGDYAKLAVTASVMDCLRDEGRKDGDIQYRVCLCIDHGAVEEKVDKLLTTVRTRADYVKAWSLARQLWQITLDREISRMFAEATQARQEALSAYRIALGRLMESREALLSLLYPDQPETVAEMMSQLTKDCVVDLCAE